MQGSSQVVQQLNHLLAGELTSSDQYFIHSEMYRNWGHHRLHERMDHERLEELEHAKRIIQRILFLEGVPRMGPRSPLTIGHTVPEMLKNDLDSELKVAADLRNAIAVCEAERDFETRRILVELLRETEEDHTHWLEVQLGLISRMGLQNYLQSVSTPLGKV